MRAHGTSLQGRPLDVLEVGPASGTTVLLSSLMHGNEAIGGLALLQVVEALLEDRELLAGCRFVVLPVVNPDAVADNVVRWRAGRSVSRRTNARGVDLNRNFPRVSPAQSWHPFSGSSLRFSPHYAGVCPASEPETRWICELARETRPDVSLAVHSFGELLLHPYGHTDAPHPRQRDLDALGRAFVSAQGSRAYTFKRSMEFYPTLGDMDDWLDAQFSTLAFTIEVGRLGLWDWPASQWFEPFCWMNMRDVDAAVQPVVSGVLALLRAHLRGSVSRPTTLPNRVRTLPIAAR